MTGTPTAQADGLLPMLPLIGAKILDLRKRRAMMIVAVSFTIGLPVLFYSVRAILHLTDPAHSGPAGASSALATAVALMAEFGFIVAVALGATAGTDDLTDGMFRHLVITGRSRLALYLARIPAGLTILIPLAAAGFAVVTLSTMLLSDTATPAVSTGELARIGAWLALGMTVAYIVGLGLGTLMGQRTVPVIVLIVLEIVITPALAGHALPHFLTVERLFVGVALAQIKPAMVAGGSGVGPTGHGGYQLPPMPIWALVTVIAAWTIGWAGIGAWKAITRDA